MPFEISPAIEMPIRCAPEVATALHDLTARLRDPLVKAHWSFIACGGQERNECGAYGCAIGHSHTVPSCVKLAGGHWSETGSGVYPSRLAHGLMDGGVPGDAVASFFYGGGFGLVETLGSAGIKYPGRSRDVTPAMVADRIDHWLATGEIR